MILHRGLLECVQVLVTFDNVLARLEFDFRASNNSDGSESGDIKIIQIGKEIIEKVN